MKTQNTVWANGQIWVRKIGESDKSLSERIEDAKLTLKKQVAQHAMNVALLEDDDGDLLQAKT